MRDYSRLEATAFPQSVAARLRVLVVGAGALGNEVLKNLALLGVGRVDVLDRDRVELSNLTRSVLFCTPDIDEHLRRGTPKAVLAAGRVREINPDVETVPLVGEVGDLGAGIVRRADVVFSCLDNEMARLELSWLCTRLDKTLVDGGLGLINPATGLVSLFPGAHGPCYACRKGGDRRRELLQELHGREDPCGLKERTLRNAGIVATTPTLASIIGALQVEIGLRAITADAPSPRARGESYRVLVHPQVLIDRMTFERSPNCPLHEPGSVVHRVVERPDRRSDAWTVAAVLAECNVPDGVLSLDWPMTARSSCRACGHAWEPWMRRARFRRERCPACRHDDIAEVEVVTHIGSASPWTGRSLASLGLPRAHIHEIVSGTGEQARHQHVEVTGDLVVPTETTSPCSISS